MARFKKKPVVIEALQWTGENHRDMFNFLGGADSEPIRASGEHFYMDHGLVNGGLMIKTLEGEHVANISDYIICGIEGEYYPCKPHIFVQTYEPAE